MEEIMNREIIRKLPKVDEVLGTAQVAEFEGVLPHGLILDTVREVLDERRTAILAGCEGEPFFVDLNHIAEDAAARLSSKSAGNLKPVINATGVVLHTNLGRARLSEAARTAVDRVASAYCNLEYDIEKGRRGHRHDLVEKIICRITGAEAAMAVNNNAAATMLCLSALGRGKEVIVSRGELVEIGGSFRVPEIMEESGCSLREVGTTNKTKVSDYERAVNEETAALMKVHTSNYRILGFTEDVNLAQLVGLGREKELPVIFDMGNGLIVDLSEYGIDEPNVETSLKTGIDVILFSGDKLLGGPQCGIIAGKKEYVEMMKRHPLARAFRVDKMTLAALEMTFRAYYDREKALKEIPVLRDITVSPAELKMKAEAFAQSLRDEEAIDGEVDVEAIEDQVGGGSAPTVKLRGWAVSLESGLIKPEKLERLLRKQEPAAIIRMGHDKAYFDVRTLRDEDLVTLKNHLVTIFEKVGEKR